MGDSLDKKKFLQSALILITSTTPQRGSAIFVFVASSSWPVGRSPANSWNFLIAFLNTDNVSSTLPPPIEFGEAFNILLVPT